MKRLANILGLALAATALFVAVGAAATLALGSHTLSAGNASVTSCGVSSLTATRDVDNSGNVSGVGVSGIPAACAGETLNITLVNSSGTSLASSSATVPAGGGSVSFSGLGTIAATNLTGYKFAVVGA
jgi:uncharacterized Zn-binding protein involved in type VI secretion